MQQQNPYAAPSAPVADVSHETSAGVFIPGGRRVPSSNGWQWIVQGFQLFKMNPGTWIAIVIIYLPLMFVLALIPVVGNLALNILFPVVTGGLMLGCDALMDDRPLEISHLFAGFKEKLGPLAMVGALYLAGIVAIGIGFALAFGFGMIANVAGWRGLALNPIAVAIIVLGFSIFMIPLVMAIWFAPALVVFHDEKPLAAMKQSFQGSYKNMMPFLLYGVAASLLFVVAMLPVFLGLLILAPTMIASVYASYRDIFAPTDLD